MGLVAYVCFMIALSVAAALLYTPSERLLAYVHCPRYYVVRRIDYLHYRSEKAHYILRFVASCASVRAVRGAVAFSELAALVGAATLLNICMEVGLQVTGHRQMRLRAYSRLPAPLAALLQAFLEGGVYFGTFFAFALHWTAGDTKCIVMYAAAWAAFPLWSLRENWPRQRAYGAKDHLSRREILGTVPSRVLQFVAAVLCWRTAPQKPVVFFRAVAAAPHERARQVEVAAGVAQGLRGVVLREALELGHEHVARARRLGFRVHFCGWCGRAYARRLKSGCESRVVDGALTW